ncbi:hypothetical protein FOZ60_016558 [Perkinsus olseni]|uniref:FLZ-type domain-containing protein n=1 Tax=Perkinsus olseni TaxID=32597 RepID=A0A7J6N3L2_PEROL|nr:hypothetical protein FOZ60_016558 [Perkinsus olseni]
MSGLVSRIYESVHYVSSGSTVTSLIDFNNNKNNNKVVPNRDEAFSCHRCGKAIRKQDNVFMYQDKTFCSRGCRKGTPGYEESLNSQPIVRSDTHISELFDGDDELEATTDDDASSSSPRDLLNRTLHFASSGDLQDASPSVSSKSQPLDTEQPPASRLYSPSATCLLLFSHITESPLMSQTFTTEDLSRRQNSETAIIHPPLSREISLVKLVNA